MSKRRPITCAFCGSRDHASADCPKESGSLYAYAIRFDFPEASGPIFAGAAGGAAGFAPSLETATVFEDIRDAERFLANAYGAETAALGRVVAVEDGEAVEVRE